MGFHNLDVGFFLDHLCCVDFVGFTGGMHNIVLASTHPMSWFQLRIGL